MIFTLPALRGQSVKQRLRLLQIKRVEAFTEPAVDRSEKIAGRIPLALIAPEPRHAHRSTQFPGLCLLRSRNGKRTLEIRLRFHRVPLERRERDFSCYTIDLGFPPPFLGCFNLRHRFADAAPSVTELAKSRISSRQI